MTEFDQSQNPEPPDKPYRIQYVFDIEHYGRLDQIPTLTKRLARELELATRRPVILRVNSTTQIDLPQNDEDEEEVGADEEG